MNREQTRAIANFYMDVAKGIVIGLFGFSIFTTAELQYKFVGNILGLLVSYICIRMALDYLKNNYDN